MFRWYHKAAQYDVYLSAVKALKLQDNAWHNKFTNSRWFTYSWTLQELLAPRHMDFFSLDSIYLGDKNLLEQEIHTIINITIDAL